MLTTPFPPFAQHVGNKPYLHSLANSKISTLSVQSHQITPTHNNNNNNQHHLPGVGGDAVHDGVVMAPSPSQAFLPSKDIYSTNNLYGTHVTPQQQLQQQQQMLQQQPASATPSNFNDYMRSSELEDTSNRSIYVSSKMISQQMETMSLTNPVNQDGSGSLPYHDPSPNPINGKLHRPQPY